MKWAMQRLEEVCRFRTGKLDSNAAVADGDFPFFTCAQETLRISEPAFDTEAVLLGGNNAAGVYPLKYYFGQFNAYQRTYVIETLNSSKLLTRFLYYALIPALTRFQSASIGAATQYLTKSILDNFEIMVPPANVQVGIVDLLSSYDDLIENNRRRIALLEESSRLLYQEWFVRLRFPGYEHTRIVDGVPEGWERKPLIELADITMGQSPESKYYNSVGEGLPFHQGVSSFGERFVSNDVCTTAQNRIALAGDILCSVRAPVGRLNITLDNVVIGRGLSAIRSLTGHQSFLFQQLRKHFFQEDLIGTGAIFASVTKAELENQKLLTPLDSLMKHFEQVSLPIDEQLRVLFLQNQKLRAARDLLLPRLMNGEIAV